MPVQPLVDLAIGFVLGFAVALLDLTGQLLAIALDHIEVVISQLAPLRLDLTPELLPIAFDLIPIHRISPVSAPPVAASGGKNAWTDGPFRAVGIDVCVISLAICAAFAFA
jgi:hypothetical protein